MRYLSSTGKLTASIRKIAESLNSRRLGKGRRTEAVRLRDRIGRVQRKLEDAQALYEQDTSDPNGLDGPAGEGYTGEQGEACEDLPSRVGTQPPAQKSQSPRPQPVAPTPPPVQSATGGGASPPVGGDCPNNTPIKGNLSSSGELIYHVPGGGYYDRTNAEECFASESAAQDAGYRASQR